MLTKMKSCPFCGFEAEIMRKPWQRDGARGTAFAVRCSVCGARTAEVSLSVLDLDDAKTVIEKVVSAWNRRADENER